MTDGASSPAAGSPLPASAAAPSMDELLTGFHSTYQRVGQAADKAKEAATYSFALAELLVRKGVLGVDELEASRRTIDQRMTEELRTRGLTISLTEDPADKYGAPAVEDIDCEARMPLCEAACCRLRFALSQQDVAEKIVHWSVSEPYLNRLGADGWCTHTDPADRHCTVYEHRPLVCRSYDCRNDVRIWKDFEARVINPELSALLAAVHEAGVPVASPQRRR